MALFKKSKAGGFMDEIRCDEPSYLIWKWHPAGSIAGNNNRENAIRWGSSLRVKEGEVAVFVYKQQSEVMQDFIVGPFDRIIETENLPVLARIIGLAYEGGTPFQAEIYFINLAKTIQVRFGVPFFDVFDPRFVDFSVPVAVRGTVTFQISDYREFIKLHRLSSFSLSDFQLQIRDAVNRYVKDAVANAPAAHNIPVTQIESKLGQINEIVENDLGKRLKEDFGVVVSGVDIGAIEIDKGSNGYRRLMSVTGDIVGATAKAEAAAAVRDIAEKQRIEAENYEETLRIQREEAQYAQHKQTQNANFAAFQVEKQAEVGVAGAAALGHMGTNGAGDVSLGGNGGEAGINMAAMMASMAIGSAVGQNIAGTMNTMMGGMGKPMQQGAVPPPLPTAVYHVAVNGQAAGPYSIDALSQMAAAGQLTRDSLVWTSGMPEWVRAESVDAIRSIFLVTPPNPPAE